MPLVYSEEIHLKKVVTNVRCSNEQLNDKGLKWTKSTALETDFLSVATTSSLIRKTRKYQNTRQCSHYSPFTLHGKIKSSAQFCVYILSDTSSFLFTSVCRGFLTRRRDLWGCVFGLQTFPILLNRCTSHVTRHGPLVPVTRERR